MSGIDGLTDNDTSRHVERVPQCAKSDFITYREAEFPDTYAEGFDMLVKMMNGCHDGRGGNLERTSVSARVAFGLFGERFMAPEPTTALVFLMQENLQT
jgi:hypothetical protein